MKRESSVHKKRNIRYISIFTVGVSGQTCEISRTKFKDLHVTYVLVGK